MENEQIKFETFDMRKRYIAKRNLENGEIEKSKTEFDMIFEKMGEKRPIRFTVKNEERDGFKELVKSCLNCKSEKGVWNTKTIKIEKRIQQGYNANHEKCDLDEQYVVLEKRNSKFFTSLEVLQQIYDGILEFEKIKEVLIEEQILEEKSEKKKLKIVKKD